MTRLFNTISIEIASLCNRKCDWCPVAYNDRPDERMEGAVLERILADLKALNYNGRVELYLYNEPTRELTYLINVITRVRYMLPRACIMIATNGDYLRGVGNILQLYAAGLNQLLINCYTKGLMERRKKWVEGLPDGITQDAGVYANTGPHKRIVDIMDKSNPASFGKGVFSLVNRAGNIPNFKPALKKPVERMCVKPFRILNINWRGDALICCQDYHGKVNIGNVLSLGVEGLWNHAVFKEYRHKLYAKNRSLPLCRECDCHAGAYPHNVPVPD